MSASYKKDQKTYAASTQESMQEALLAAKELDEAIRNINTLSHQFEGKACGINQKRLYACLNKNDGDAAACQYFFDSLRECQDNLKYQNGHQ